MRRTVGVAAAGAIAIALATGCSRSADNAQQSASASQTTTAAKVTRAERLHSAALRRQAARRARIRAAFARFAAQEQADASAGTQTFTGDYFAIDYPATWTVSANEEPKGGYYDTTIHASNQDKMLRVDVQPQAPNADPLANARPVIASLESQPGYRQLSLSRTTIAGYDAVYWEFLVNEHGVLLHKVDAMFVDDAGDGIAVLTQAPARSFRFWTTTFADLRDSIVPNDVSTSASESAASGSGDFCSTHSCIANFDNGVGYIVQCADGMWSHSGGRPGACSYHGGETSNVYTGGVAPPYSSSSSGGTDLGPGNGYTVTCADGSISHSGGIQGACSHHGGVGP